MAYDAKTERLIALKKLAGKAQTSNDKGLANEALPSGLTLSSETVFGQEISKSPASANLYDVTGQVEYLRFQCSFIAGSDTSDGRHGFELKLPSDYQSNSSNPSAGTYPYINDQAINITSGSLQLVPPSFATSYEGKPFYGGSSAKDSGTQIPVLDARDWYLDYFNGIFFQQDPPGTGDHSNNPDFLEGYLYIGKYLNTVVSEGSSGGGNGDKSPQYLVLAATASLPNERVFTAGTGIKTTDSGAGAAYTVAVRDSIVATLTGSIFSGTVSAPALSGSLTKLQDGTSYIKEGSNVTVTTASNGSITIASTNTTYTAGDGLDLSGTVFSTDLKSAGGLKIDSTELAIDDSVVATISGSTFTGAVKFNSGLSGSLTHLTDGTSYLKAGLSITVTTASNGSITIASTDTTYTAGAGLDLSGTEFSVDLKSAGGLKIDTTELAIDNSVVATLTGSIFSGDVEFNSGLTGSLQSLIDGTPYLRSGTGISIATASNGAVTITATGGGGGVPGGSNTQIQFNDAGSFAGDSTFTFNKTTNTLVVPNLSGSLTRLSNGTSYLRPGNNVSIVSGSDGSITITALSQGGGSGDANVEYLVSELSGSTPNAKLVEAGAGITIITGSNSFTISANSAAISGRDKNRYLLTSSHPTNTAFFVPFTDFSDVLFNSNLIDIYLNGQLLNSGSAANVVAGTADYSIIASSSMRFSFGLATDDQVYTILSKIEAGGGGSTDTSAQYLVLSATGSLSNERVFTAGTGITTIDAGAGSPYTVSVDNSIVATLTGSIFSGTVSAPALSGSLTKLQDGTSYLRAGSNITITSGSAGSIAIASTASETRTKQSYFLAANYSSNTSVPVGSSNFSDASYDPDKIDIFVNGMLVHSGTVGQIEAGDRDYYVSSATSLKYSFNLKIGDVIDVVVFSVS